MSTSNLKWLRDFAAEWDGSATFSEAIVAVADELQQLRAERDELLAWKSEAVTMCAKRRCADRDARIAALEAALEKANREASALQQWGNDMRAMERTATAALASRDRLIDELVKSLTAVVEACDLPDTDYSSVERAALKGARDVIARAAALRKDCA